MKIKYLGTAAYEGIPALFCNCDVCRRSFERGGRNIRSRSQALINDDLLIDFNADTVSHYQKYHFDMDKIDNCLITHSHCDHFYPDDMMMATKGYSATNEHVLTYYGGKSVLAGIEKTINSDFLKGFWELNRYQEVEAYKQYTIGKYQVLPLEAVHDLQSTPFIYLISDGTASILYAHDTGHFTSKCIEVLRDYGKIDIISLDCTMGVIPANKCKHHLSFYDAEQIRQQLTEIGCVDKDTKFVLNHFSHNGNVTYDDIRDIAEKDGFIVSYDGLEVEC